MVILDEVSGVVQQIQFIISRPILLNLEIKNILLLNHLVIANYRDIFNQYLYDVSRYPLNPLLGSCNSQFITKLNSFCVCATMCHV